MSNQNNDDDNNDKINDQATSSLRLPEPWQSLTDNYDCISGEIIPILFFIVKANCSSLLFNPAVILLDLWDFRFVKHELCRPYIVLWLNDNNNNDNNDDNKHDNDNKDDNDEDDNDEDDNDNENDNNNNNNIDDNDNHNSNNQNYFSLIPQQFELILFSKLVSWLSKLLLKARDIAENPGPVIRSQNIRNILSFTLAWALLFVYSVKLGENEENVVFLIL